jgi:hypothetical protein
MDKAALAQAHAAALRQTSEWEQFWYLKMAWLCNTLAALAPAHAAALWQTSELDNFAVDARCRCPACVCLVKACLGCGGRIACLVGVNRNVLHLSLHESQATATCCPAGSPVWLCAAAERPVPTHTGHSCIPHHSLSPFIQRVCCAVPQDPLFGSVQPLFARQIFNPTALAYCPWPIILEGAGGRLLASH